jgi:hypothetical protein
MTTVVSLPGGELVVAVPEAGPVAPRRLDPRAAPPPLSSSSSSSARGQEEAAAAAAAAAVVVVEDGRDDPLAAFTDLVIELSLPGPDDGGPDDGPRGFLPGAPPAPPHTRTVPLEAMRDGMAAVAAMELAEEAARGTPQSILLDFRSPQTRQHESNARALPGEHLSALARAARRVQIPIAVDGLYFAVAYILFATVLESAYPGAYKGSFLIAVLGIELSAWVLGAAAVVLNAPKALGAYVVVQLAGILILLRTQFLTWGLVIVRTASICGSMYHRLQLTRTARVVAYSQLQVRTIFSFNPSATPTRLVATFYRGRVQETGGWRSTDGVFHERTPAAFTVGYWPDPRAPPSSRRRPGPASWPGSTSAGTLLFASAEGVQGLRVGAAMRAASAGAGDGGGGPWGESGGASSPPPRDSYDEEAVLRWREAAAGTWKARGEGGGDGKTGSG